MKLLLSVLFLIFTGLNANSQDLKAPKELKKGKLKNGLTYYIYPNKKPEGEAVYRLFIKSGSVVENENQRGLAHFLEHMAFNGTENLPGNSLVKYLESKGARFGADLNAHTSMTETVYKLQLPSADPEMVDSTIMILADWAGGLLLDSLEIEDERGVIMSEWLLRVGPEYDAQNAFLMELLNGSRFSKRLTIGDTAVIKNFKQQELRDYYNTWYDPSIMAVAVVGDVNAKKTKKLIKKHFANMTSSLKGELPQYDIPDYNDVEYELVSHESLKDVELNVIQLLEKPRPVLSEKDYPGYLQRVLLNRLIKARFSELSFTGPAYRSASYSYSSFLNRKGILLGSVKLTPTKIRDGVIDFATSAEQLFRYGFTSTEIEKVKTTYINSLRREVESEEPRYSSSLMNEIYSEFYVGNKIVSAQDEYKLAEKYINVIDSVKLVTQLKMLRKPNQTHYLATTFDRAENEIPEKEELIHIFDSLRTAEIKPYVSNVAMHEELLSELPDAGEIVHKTYLKEIDAHQLLLSNGATVIFKQSSLSPNNINFSGFRQGGLYALDSTNYVSGRYATNIIGMSGAGDFSRESLSQFLSGKSASMRFTIANTRTGMVGNSNIEDIELMFQLLYLKWTKPVVDSAVFELSKEKAIEAYQTKNETPSNVFYEDLSLLLNGKNYTSRKITDERLEKELQLNKLLPIYHSELNSANGYNFVIVGDCSIDDIIPYIELYIGGLPGDPAHITYKYKYQKQIDTDTAFVRNVSENAKSTVSLIFQSNDSINNYGQLSLLNDVTQAVIRSRLLEVLREEMGMIYSVGVQISQTQYPSNLRRAIIRFSCEPENTDTLIQATMKQLEMMANDPSIFNKALSDVKLNLIKDWNLEKQKNLYWSGAIRDNIFNKINDWDFLVKYNKIVEEINPPDISGNINHMFFETPVIKAVLNPKPEENI